MRLPDRTKDPMSAQMERNENWSMDFMQDRLTNGRKIRTFNLIDDFNREVLAIEIDTSLSGERVIKVLQEVIDYNGKPKQIRIDNDPEFICKKLEVFLINNGIEHKFIQLGKLTQNAYIERFNRKYRKDVLNVYLFESLYEVRSITKTWIQNYNQNHPPKALIKQSPYEYAVNSGKHRHAKNANPKFITINSKDYDEIIIKENKQLNELYFIFNPS